MTVGQGVVREARGRDARFEHGSNQALAQAARKVSLTIGDGCLIRARDQASGDFVLLAADHREPTLRSVIRAAEPLKAPGGWIGQALQRDCVLRLPSDATDLEQAGIPAALGVADAIAVPIASAASVLIAVRGSSAGEFSFADRIALEHIVAELWPDNSGNPGGFSLEADPGSGNREDPVPPDLTRLLDQTPAGVWLIDAAGRTEWVNQAASEIVGIPAERLKGAPVPEFVAGADGALGEGLFADQHSDRKLRRPDGRELWLSATSRPLFDCGGGPAGTLLTFVDIDERKRREVELRMRLDVTDALINLTELSLDAPSFAAVLTQASRLVVEQLGVALASVSVIDRPRNELRVLAAVAQEEHAWAEELRRPSPRRIREGSFALASLTESSTVVVDDFATEAGYSDLAAHRIRSGAFVPLGDQQSVLAVLSHDPAALDAGAVKLLETIAHLVESYRAVLSETRPHQCHGRPFVAPTVEQGSCERAVSVRRFPRRPGRD